jgi:hypothetical protein
LSWTVLAVNIARSKVEKADFKEPAQILLDYGGNMNYMLCGLLAWFTTVVVLNMIEYFSGSELV